MKRAKQHKKQTDKLLVSVDRVRTLTTADLREVAGGSPDPCSHSNNVYTTC